MEKKPNDILKIFFIKIQLKKKFCKTEFIQGITFILDYIILKHFYNIEENVIKEELLERLEPFIVIEIN